MVEISQDTDLLFVVDVQNDFISGRLPVPGGEEVVPVINEYRKKIQKVIFTKDHHPAEHCSFMRHGGGWPPHCVIDTEGNKLHVDLNAEDESKVAVLTKGINKLQEEYSGFDQDNPVLTQYLEDEGITRLFVCGLATDYCVKATVLDALKTGMPVFLLADAIRAANLKPKDGEDAIAEMLDAGVAAMVIDDIE